MEWEAEIHQLISRTITTKSPLDFIIFQVLLKHSPGLLNLCANLWDTMSSFTEGLISRGNAALLWRMRDIWIILLEGNTYRRKKGPGEGGRPKEGRGALFSSLILMPVTELLKLLIAGNQLVFCLINGKNKRYFTESFLYMISKFPADPNQIQDPRCCCWHGDIFH